ncbi:septal ring lytic transglycosylase RlpA family protein [uncultured Sphingomonas sp.]|uniref:septal ring lytic transglycosylase RlpA family protein n=1 Tax=uncultured Sphingomonas sp. TaxID=158754 RepID=UPI0035CA57F8
MRWSNRRAPALILALVPALAACSGRTADVVPPAAIAASQPVLSDQAGRTPDLPPASDDGPPAASGPAGTSGGADRYDEVGLAGWYGEELAGKPTASGSPFDPAAMTAAHRTLPLGAFAEVTALDSGRTILVEITDRGPGRRDRVIDLSRGAAQALGLDAVAVAGVRVRRVTPAAADQAAIRSGRAAASRLDTPPALLAGLRAQLPKTGVPPAPGPAAPPTKIRAPAAAGSGYFVQVAAFSSRDRAAALARVLGARMIAAGKVYRVRLGPFATIALAAQARDAVAARGYGDARVVRED